MFLAFCQRLPTACPAERNPAIILGIFQAVLADAAQVHFFCSCYTCPKRSRERGVGVLCGDMRLLPRQDLARFVFFDELVDFGKIWADLGQIWWKDLGKLPPKPAHRNWANFRRTRPTFRRNLIHIWPTSTKIGRHRATFCRAGQIWPQSTPSRRTRATLGGNRGNLGRIRPRFGRLRLDSAGPTVATPLARDPVNAITRCCSQRSLGT